MTDFNVLCELGKFGKHLELNQQVSEFFWRIICESDQYNDELLQACITKFGDMVKFWSIE